MFRCNLITENYHAVRDWKSVGFWVIGFIVFMAIFLSVSASANAWANVSCLSYKNLTITSGNASQVRTDSLMIFNISNAGVHCTVGGQNCSIYMTDDAATYPLNWTFNATAGNATWLFGLKTNSSNSNKYYPVYLYYNCSFPSTNNSFINTSETWEGTATLNQRSWWRDTASFIFNSTAAFGAQSLLGAGNDKYLLYNWTGVVLGMAYISVWAYDDNTNASYTQADIIFANLPGIDGSTQRKFFKPFDSGTKTYYSYHDGSLKATSIGRTPGWHWNKFYYNGANFTWWIDGVNVGTEIAALAGVKSLDLHTYQSNLQTDNIVVATLNFSTYLGENTWAFGAEENPPAAGSYGIVLSAPINNSNNGDFGAMRFNYTISGSAATYNCSVYLNGTLNMTNSSAQNNTLTIQNVTMSPGKWMWNVSCITPVFNASGINYFTVYGMNVSLSNPAFYPNATSQGTNVTFNVTASAGAASVWVSIWQGVTTIATQVLTFITGTLWSGQVTTNSSYAGYSNVTFYGNDTYGNVVSHISYGGPLNLFETFNSGGSYSGYVASYDGQTLYINQTITNISVNISYGVVRNSTISIFKYDINSTLLNNLIFIKNSTVEVPATGDLVYFNFNGLSLSSGDYYLEFDSVPTSILSLTGNPYLNGQRVINRDLSALYGVDSYFALRGALYNSTNIQQLYVYPLLNITGASVQPNYTWSGQNVTMNATVTGNVDKVQAAISNSTGNISLTALSSIGGGLWSGKVPINNSVSYYGELNVTFSANDTFGNNVSLFLLNGINITVNYGPQITLLAPDAWAALGHITNISFNFSAIDDHSLNFSCDYLINNTLNFTNGSVQNNTLASHDINVSTGSYQWLIHCFDEFNMGTGGPRYFTVDNDAPVISNLINISTNESAVITYNTNEGANMTLNYGTDLDLLSGALNGSYIIGHIVNLSSLLNGTLYYYNITSCDVYGNCIVNGVYNFTTLAYGSTAPTITITYPTANLKMNTKNYFVQINFTVTDLDSNVVNCSSIGDGIVQRTFNVAAAGGSYTTNVTLFGGVHTVKINCTDLTGYVGDPPVNITLPYEKMKQIIILKSGVNYTNWTATLVGDKYNSTYPENISIDWGADLSQEWNYSGQLSGSSNAAIPNNTIESWKAGCANEICSVDILFKSDTQGLMNVTNMNLSYQRNESNYPGAIGFDFFNDTVLDGFNNTWLNGISTTVALNITNLNNYLGSPQCIANGGNMSAEVSSFISGVLLLDNLLVSYNGNVSPISITNASVTPQVVFPNQNVTINATVNISGAIYNVDILQNTLFDGGFASTNNNASENFTAPRKSAIGRVDVYDAGTTSGNLTLSIYNETWGFMGSRTLTNYSAGWILFDFTGGNRIRMNANSEYRIEVTSDGNNWNNLGYSDNDTYPNGTLFLNRTPIMGKDLMFRMLLYDYDVGSVWFSIWSGVTTWFTGFMEWISGDLWSAQIAANASWGDQVNVTIYANTTTGQIANPVELNFTIANVTAPVLENATVSPGSPQNYSGSRIYSFSADCWSPYNVSMVQIEHNFTGSLNTYNMSYTGSGNMWDYAYQAIAVGNWSWKIMCFDMYNLTNSTPYYNYEIDRGIPNLQIFIRPSPVPSYIDLVNITCISDNMESLATLKIDNITATNPTISTFPIGTYFLECSQPGTINWNDAYINGSMTVINQLPNIVLVSPPDAYNFPASTTSVLLQFNVTDPDSTNLQVTILVNGTANTTFYTNQVENSYLLNVTSNATYSWAVIARDEVNVVTSNSSTFTVAAPSIDAFPTINLIFPGNNSDLANTFAFINFSFELNDTDTPNLDYNLFVDGFSRCVSNVPSNAIYSCIVGPFVPNSSHSWFVNASDLSATVQSYIYVFTINATCTPNWVPLYTSCLPLDLNIKYYGDSNSCGNDTTIPGDNATSTACDYCAPNFNCSAYYSCQPGGRQDCAIVGDSNSCFAQTGLSSDAYSGDMSEFNRGCTYRSVLVAIPQEAGAGLAIFIEFITTPLGILLLWIVILAIMLALGLVVAMYIRERA